MQQKIELLFCLLESYLQNEPQIDDENVQEFLFCAIKVLQDKTCAKGWLQQVSQRMQHAIEKHQNIELWLNNELQKFGVVKANFCEPRFKSKNIDCMGLFYILLGERKPKEPLQCKTPADWRIRDFLDQNHGFLKEHVSLNLGDLLVYPDENQNWSHVAIFLGNRGGKNYVLSKFGQRYPAYIHPIDVSPYDTKGLLCFGFYLKNMAYKHQLRKLFQNSPLQEASNEQKSTTNQAMFFAHEDPNSTLASDKQTLDLLSYPYL